MCKANAQHVFIHIIMMELQLYCENGEGWVRQDPRRSGYLRQALLQRVIATVSKKDGQYATSERKIKLITYFEVGLGYILITEFLRSNIILSRVEIIREGIFYTCRSFTKDILFSVLTGSFLIQTFSQLQCIILSTVISFS